MRSICSLIALLAVTVAVASCGGPPARTQSTPASQIPGIGGLVRDVQAAHAAVAASQREAARESATSAGQ
jgi:hypothetical protein